MNTGSPVWILNAWLAADPVIDEKLAGMQFVPLQGQPEHTDTFVTYRIKDTTDDIYAVRMADVSYSIYSYSYDDAIAIEQAIIDKCAHDHAGQRLQQTLGVDPAWFIHDLEFVQSFDLSPPDQEGGRFGRLVIIRMRYTDPAGTDE